VELPGGSHQFSFCLAELGIKMIQNCTYFFWWLFLAEPVVMNCWEMTFPHRNYVGPKKLMWLKAFTVCFHVRLYMGTHINVYKSYISHQDIVCNDIYQCLYQYVYISIVWYYLHSNISQAMRKWLRQQLLDADEESRTWRLRAIQAMDIFFVPKIWMETHG